MKTIKNQKKRDQLKSLLFLLKNIKKYKLDLKDKIESNKNFDKRIKKKNKIKSRRTKLKHIIYINQKSMVKLKTNKTLTKQKMTKIKNIRNEF